MKIKLLKIFLVICFTGILGYIILILPEIRLKQESIEIIKKILVHDKKKLFYLQLSIFVFTIPDIC